MPFKVSHDRWLQVEADRVQVIIEMPKFWHRGWTPQSLQEALLDLGLEYSMPQITEINDELHRRAVVEDVPE